MPFTVPMSKEIKKYRHYINGEWCDASDGGIIKTLNPTTEAVWAEAPAATVADVDRAVATAKSTLYRGEWAAMTASQRGKMINRLAALTRENAPSLGITETVDSGKLLAETRSQATYVADYYEYFAGLADKLEGATLPIDKPNMHVYTLREPIGVVAAVVPWNAQMFLTATKLGPALAAGNTVVIKASEDAPATMFEFAKLVEQAGFPPGVVNVITGHGESCGKALTSHPDVSRVAFTGGPVTASRIIRNTARNFAMVSLELGGKSPIVVFADANLEGAVNGIIAGNFGASGQSCVAGSRVILHESIHDQVVDMLIERAKQIELGNPLDENTQMGPLATAEQLEHVKSTVTRSREQGASLFHGGARPGNQERGYFFEPTILGCPHQDFESVDRELFGPVMSVLKFKEPEQAIDIANNTRFGLGAGIFTESLSLSHWASSSIRSGIVYVNTYRVISPIAPFGGFAQSGYGREAGSESLLDYTRTKTVWVNTSDRPMSNPFIVR